jgi:hypothetical protein
MVTGRRWGGIVGFALDALDLGRPKLSFNQDNNFM